MDFNEVIMNCVTAVHTEYPSAGFLEAVGTMVKNGRKWTPEVSLVSSIFRLDEEHLIYCRKGITKDQEGHDVEYDYDIEVVEIHYTGDKISDPSEAQPFTEYFEEVQEEGYRIYDSPVTLRCAASSEETVPSYVMFLKD